MFIFDDKKLDESLTVGELQNKLLRFNRDMPVVVSADVNVEEGERAPTFDVYEPKVMLDIESNKKVCTIGFDDSEPSDWSLTSSNIELPPEGANWSEEGKRAWIWITSQLEDNILDIETDEDVFENIADNFYLDDDLDDLLDNPEFNAIVDIISRKYHLSYTDDDTDDEPDYIDNEVAESLTEATRPFFGPGSERSEEENILLGRIKEFNEIWKNDKRLTSLNDDDIWQWWNIFRGLLVPDTGRSDTLAGECISAFDYGFSRYLNDGDWYYGYGDTYNESCRKSMNFLRDYVPQVGYISMNSNDDASQFQIAAYRAILSKIFSQEYFNRRDFNSWRSYPVRR